VRDNPDLFQKAQIDMIECDDGWYNIIHVLCKIISSRADGLRARLKYETDKNNFDKVNEIEAQLQKEIADLPIIQQVKEKFGTLRFYVDGGTDECYDYIRMAEAMSAHTCEECGNKGESRTGSWIKVLCDVHNTERESFRLEREAYINQRRQAGGPLLSDESNDE